MSLLPPGTLLQLMYLRERVGHIKPGRLIEIGPASGEITWLLLDLGWTERSYDLEAVTIERLHMRFAKEIEQGRYWVVNADYLSQLWLLGGMVISFIGVVGIYLSKIFFETKQRPYTIVRQIYAKQKD